ncbi:MGMT family protein [Candidatus Woesearchaeota archaeon]|jgi:methylated-DNA-[protein]-cysteine S-methyltransferase|nr:MGMT family protein [Candidatus Woesearchaeota archaeon]MBT6518401.1 MGMT family protein [Candidatus Woesearchaeota archaeon]MBT7366583.1 MGMT family protein [Candidatus Woesearchaeota archaeon]
MQKESKSKRNKKEEKVSFNQSVWNTCKKIPKGKVSTYKEIAKALNTKAYRAVGNALNRNPHWPIVPCHRVINSDGKLGGFASGPKRKIKLLKSEGINIKDDKIIDFNKVLFKFDRLI